MSHDEVPAASSTDDATLATVGPPQHEVIRTDGNAIVLDLSIGAALYGESLPGMGVDRLGQLIDRAKAEAGTGFAFGRYAEPRDLYHTDNFAGESERRDLHLGIDVFCAAGTDVFSPLDGIVEIVANNTAELDYGPMLVLRHQSADDQPFFTLYGHLRLTSVAAVRAGDPVAAGDKIAEVGHPPENGNWPPHLHFQVITDLLGLGADFPGVAYRSEQQKWLRLSPSPAPFFPGHDAQQLNVQGRA